MPSGACLRHPEQAGVPCARCGTFACAECLSGGLCPTCRHALGVSAPQPGDLAGFGSRLAARLIDVAGGYAAALAGGLLAGIVLAILTATGTIAPGWEQRVSGGLGEGLFAGIGTSVISLTLSTWVCGASLGKVLLGLRVVREDGAPPTLLAAFTREALLYVDSFFFGLVGYQAMQKSPLRQRVGDSSAKTIVVHARRVSAAARASPGLLVAGVSVALLSRAVLLAAFFVYDGW